MLFCRRETVFLVATGDEMTTLSLLVVSVSESAIVCTVQATCTLPAHSDMTVHGSGVHNNMPILSTEDKAKIVDLCSVGVHYLCLAYCRSAADILEVRAFLEECASLPTAAHSRELQQSPQHNHFNYSNNRWFVRTVRWE
jgi:hypothetical protein